MSDYEIEIECLHCGTQKGYAHDDYFGPRHYGYKCYKCGRVYDARNCTEVPRVRPKDDARWRITTTEEGQG